MYQITDYERELLVNNAEDIFNGQYEKILLHVVLDVFGEIQKSGIDIEIDEQGHISKKTCMAVMNYILS